MLDTMKCRGQLRRIALKGGGKRLANARKLHQNFGAFPSERRHPDGIKQFRGYPRIGIPSRSEEHTSELQSLRHLVCRLLLEKKKKQDAKPQKPRKRRLDEFT